MSGQSPDSPSGLGASVATPACPVCGYARLGIAPDARCPECGSEGFDGVFAVHGSSRLAGLGTIVTIGMTSVYAVLLGLAVVRDVTRSSRVGTVWTPRSSAGELLLLVILVGVIAALVVRLRRGGRPSPDGLRPRRGVIVWNVHPRGIEVREGPSRAWIPREHVAGIECVDSMIGDVSQLMIVMRRTTLVGAIGRTRIVYVRGSKDERRATWRAVRTTIGLG